MSLNLSAYNNIGANLFVRLDIPDYEVLRFSDATRPIIVNGENYQDLGSLLGITPTTNEIRPTGYEMMVTISGIPSGNISDIMDNPVKGSLIEIRRLFFNPDTGAALNIVGNPALKFRGIVTNYSLDEEWDNISSTSSYSITLICSSDADLLSKKVSGRRTNPNDQKKWFPTDISMDRVATVTRSNFQFGAPITVTKAK